MLLFRLALLAVLASSLVSVRAQQQPQPLKVAIAGLTHTHVHSLLGQAGKNGVQIIGIAEPNRELAQRYFKQYGLPDSLLYSSLDDLLRNTKPEAVFAFNSIFGHLEVVEKCAPRRIHVMVEKPLAVNLAHAQKMQALARKYSIQLLTNYETTWYASNHKAYELLHTQKALGDVRKVVVHDGHRGPKEIDVNKEFLDWLTDPLQNGGGAVIDFGCYGANLMTWLMKGERPLSVTAVLQQLKPDVYPKVDDEATIVLTYPKAQGIVQASWNWPFSRKDMEVYGQRGYAVAETGSRLRYRVQESNPDSVVQLPERPFPFNNPYSYFAAVVHGTVKPSPFELSSLENNMIVVEILDAAIRSAKEGAAIKLATAKK